MNEIAIEPEVADELRQLQAAVAQVQGQIVELAVILGAYGALPAALQQAVQKLAQVSQSRDDKLKKLAALAGVDLDAPEHAGKWSWSPADGSLRKAG